MTAGRGIDGPPCSAYMGGVPFARLRGGGRAGGFMPERSGFELRGYFFVIPAKAGISF